MIRINLLAAEAAQSKARRFNFKIDLAGQVTALCAVILLGTVAALGMWYWSLSAESARIDAEAQAIQQEMQRLRPIVLQVEQFEARREQLRQRVALIEELRAGQNGPVHLLDEVSRSVPDRLWLTAMTQKGADVQINGRTTSLTSLAQFVANLETSGYFAPPVEILDSKVEDSEIGDLVTFSVKAQFSPPAL